MIEHNQAGLSNLPRSAWPKVGRAADDKKAIERLVPDSDIHERVLTYIKRRLDYAERKMTDFHARWQHNERLVQAYIDLPDYEKIIQAQTDTGKAPGVVQINVPYTWATISAIVTYSIHTLAGRKPMFQVASNDPTYAEKAQNMELVLQYNADHARLIKDLFQYLWDAETYGVGVLKCLWMVDKRYRSVMQKEQTFGYLDEVLSDTKVRVRDLRTIFEGNDIESVDPYLFLPDPRVPMHDCAKKGEFMFCRAYEGRHKLKKLEAQGLLRWVSHVGNMPSNLSDVDSSRSMRSMGDSISGRATSDEFAISNSVQKDVGTIELIPAELGLGKSERVEKWFFAIGNGRQILMAERFDSDHDMHPFAVTEPYTMGHSFGSMGMADLMGPMQSTVSWFINSHIHNVRSALNNMFVVDPSMVEMQDLKNPEPGKLIRLKRAAFGQDVRSILQQLKVTDTTKDHMKDLETITRFADGISAITDNVRGLQDGGGRKTATEVRTSGEAAASRLASHVRLISAQSITDLTEMMSLNYQQLISEEFQIRILGKDGMENPIRITPEDLLGDFHYPINDGTLPLDRVAMVDVWKELFMGIAGDQELRQSFDIKEIFKWIADLSGAKSLDRFELNPMPDDMLAAQAQAGNVVPIGSPGGQTPGVTGSPGDRLAGGIPGVGP